MKLSPTQINALRLASSVPSSLSAGTFYRPTTDALLRMGLIESYGSRTLGDGYSDCTYGITEQGRIALADAG